MIPKEDPIVLSDRSLRQAPDQSARLAYLDLVIDVTAQRVWLRGEESRLTPREFGVLVYLIRHAGRLVPDAELLDAVWGSHAVIGDAALRTVIKRLRRKLGEDSRYPRYISTVWGRGYRFNRSSPSI